MREVVTIHGGQCGNHVGTKFLEMVAGEQGVDCTGSLICGRQHHSQVYFRERQYARCAPRTVLFDLDPNLLTSIRASPFGHLFDPGNCVSGLTGAGNNWAKGHYTEGPEIVETVMERVRRETEECEALQGFQLCHALGGGTGSGLGSLLLSKLVEEYPSRSIATFSIFPASLDGDCIVHPYNSLLTLPYLTELAHSVILTDNDALYTIGFRRAALRTPFYSDLNQLIALAMSGATSTLRLGADVCDTMLRLHVNLVPFPRLHFLSVGITPIRRDEGNTAMSQTVKEVFSPDNRLCGSGNGVFLGALGVFRGHEQAFSTEMIEHAEFAEWIPDSFKAWSCTEAQPGYTSTGTLLGNHTGVREVLQRVWERFCCLYSRKAFVHWYFGEGMEEGEFQEAASSVQDLIDEYQLLTSQ